MNRKLVVACAAVAFAALVTVRLTPVMVRLKPDTMRTPRALNMISSFGTDASSTARAARGIAPMSAVRGDTIALIAPSITDPARASIDAGGQIVSPGFIDIHNHARENIFELPTADNYIRQGVTTIIEGPDGGSPVPLAASSTSSRRRRNRSTSGRSSGRARCARRSSAGPTGGRRPAELDKMRGIVDEGMKAGAFGMSTGLFYVPGAFTPIEEVIELAKVAAKHGGIHISHMRDEAFGVLESVRETIRIGEEGGLPTQVTHHKIVGRPTTARASRRLSCSTPRGRAASMRRAISILTRRRATRSSHR